jgi:hypothetical protein
MEFIIYIYLAIGLILSFYWFNRDYSKDYEEAVKNDRVEKGAAGMLLLSFCVLWPIKLLRNLIKYNKI